MNLKNCDSIEIKVGSGNHPNPIKILSTDKKVEKISWSEEGTSFEQGAPKITYSPKKLIRRQIEGDSNNNNRKIEIREFNHSETGPFTPVRNLKEPKPVGLVRPIVRPQERVRSPSISSDISAGSSADTATIHALASEILSELEMTQAQFEEEYHRPSRSRSVPRRRAFERSSENRRMRSVDQRHTRHSSRRDTFDSENQTRGILAQLIRMPGVLLLTTEEEKINITVTPVRQTLTSLVNFLQEQGLSVNDYNLRLAPHIRSSGRQSFV